MNLSRNRRGAAFDMIWWIVNFILLILVFIVFSASISWFANLSLDDHAAKGSVIINRIYYAPTGISYHDEVRSYPGIIDPQRFTPEILSQSINLTPNKQFAAKLTLYDEQHQSYGAPIYLNEEWYRRWNVLVSFKGKGSAVRRMEERNVLIRDAFLDRNQPGYLRIDVVMPND